MQLDLLYAFQIKGETTLYYYALSNRKGVLECAKFDLVPCSRSGVVEERSLVLYRVLPCLVRLCRAEEATENRILAAETLAYLIEVGRYCMRGRFWGEA